MLSFINAQMPLLIPSFSFPFSSSPYPFSSTVSTTLGLSDSMYRPKLDFSNYTSTSTTGASTMFSTALWCALPSLAVAWVTGVLVIRYLRRRKYLVGVDGSSYGIIPSESRKIPPSEPASPSPACPTSFSSPSSPSSSRSPLAAIPSLSEMKPANPSGDDNHGAHLTVPSPSCTSKLQLMSLNAVVVQAKDEDCDTDTPRAFAFTNANHPTPFNAHKSVTAAFRELVEWNESDTPTPRGSVCLPCPSSLSGPESNPNLNIGQGQVEVEGPFMGLEQELGLEFDCNPFPSPPPSPPLITSGSPGERRIVVRPLDGPSSPSSGPDSSTTATTSSSTSPIILNDHEPSTGSQLPHPALAVPQPSLESHAPPRQHVQPRETFELIFDPTSNRYILPPSLSPHVSHLRYHLSRAYERRKAEEALKEAKGKVRGEIRAFEGRWRGMGRRRGREKDKDRDAGETRDRIRGVREGLKHLLSQAPSHSPCVPIRMLEEEQQQQKAGDGGGLERVLRVEDPISPSHFLSILQSHSRESKTVDLEEIDVKLKLWEGWEWDVEIEWGLEFCRPESSAAFTGGNSTELQGAETATYIHLPHLKRLKITPVDGLPLRPILEWMKVPLLEDVCIDVTTSAQYRSSSPSLGGNRNTGQRQSTSPRQTQKMVGKCLEGDPWTALGWAEVAADAPVRVELRIPPKIQFDEEKWVEDVRAARCEGRVVRC